MAEQKRQRDKLRERALQTRGKQRYNGRQPNGITSSVLAINRVQKVTKGGYMMNFSALVVAGNMRGAAGYGVAKGDNVRTAVHSAFENAWNNFVYVDRYADRTLFHDVEGKRGSTKIVMRSAKEGKGLVASNVVRSICVAFGIQDCVSKCYGQRNPFAVVQATFDALQNQQSPTQVGLKRGKKFIEL